MTALWKLSDSQGPKLKGSHLGGEPTFGRAGERGLQGVAELVIDERQRSAGLPGVHVQLDSPVQLRSALALRCDAPHQGPPLLWALDEALHGTCTERAVTIETLSSCWLPCPCLTGVDQTRLSYTYSQP